MTDKPQAATTSFLRAFGDTHEGKVRTNNEDTFFVDKERGIFIVVDGMGGHNAGEVAAKIACETVKRSLEESTDDPKERLRLAIIQANNEIVQQAQTSPDWEGMQCVMTAAVVTGEALTIGHVGDTRLYKLRSGQIEKVTHDHSPVGVLEDLQQVSEIEAMELPNRNEVFRSLGDQRKDESETGFVEIIEGTLAPGEAILLCSDGLSDLLTSTRILGIVEEQKESEENIVKSLIEEANDKGGKDNITVVYAEQLVAPVDAPENWMNARILAPLLLLVVLTVGTLSFFQWRSRQATSNQVAAVPAPIGSQSVSLSPLSLGAEALNSTPSSSAEADIASLTRILEGQKKSLALTYLARSQIYRRNGNSEAAAKDCEEAKKLDHELNCEPVTNQK